MVIVAVSDKEGLVGAFYSVREAAEAVADWGETPLLFQQFGVADGPLEAVWAVPYSANGAVAFVSNNREAAELVQRSLYHVGLAWDDSIDYWEVLAGEVIAPAKKRRDLWRAARCQDPPEPGQGARLESSAGQLLGRLGDRGLRPADAGTPFGGAQAPAPGGAGGAEPGEGGICRFVIPVSPPVAHAPAAARPGPPA